MPDVVVTKITEIIYFVIPVAITIAAIIFWQGKNTGGSSSNKKRNT